MKWWLSALDCSSLGLTPYSQVNFSMVRTDPKFYNKNTRKLIKCTQESRKQVWGFNNLAVLSFCSVGLNKLYCCCVSHPARQTNLWKRITPAEDIFLHVQNRFTYHIEANTDAVFSHCFCRVTNLQIVTNATIQKTKEKPFDVYIINPQKLNAKKNTGQLKMYTLNRSFI